MLAPMNTNVTVIGGGLAGSEAALSLAARGFSVRLVEMRPGTPTAVHHTAGLAELVCSNSLKSTKPDSAAGMLKAELDRLGRPSSPRRGATRWRRAARSRSTAPRSPRT